MDYIHQTNHQIPSSFYKPLVSEKDKLEEKIENLKPVFPRVEKTAAPKPFTARKVESVHTLPLKTCKKIYDFCLANQKTLPQADNGKTTVYLPNEYPEHIVKCSGRSSENRQKTMFEFRKLIEELNLSHLFVPKSCVVGYVLVEERAPIKHDREATWIGFYLDHQEEFTQAIKDLAELSFHAKFKDMCGSSRYFFRIEGFMPSRYDNLPIIEHEGEYKIALIDLEMWETEKPSQESLIINLKNVIRAFPYHLEAVLEIIESREIKLSKEELNSLSEMAEKGKEYLTKVHLGHKHFLEEKKISTENPRELFSPSSEQIEKLKAKAVDRWLNSSYDDVEKSWMFHEGVDQEEAVGELAEKLIDYLFSTYLPKLLDENLKSTSELTKDTLLDIRQIELATFAGGLMSYYHFSKLIDESKFKGGQPLVPICMKAIFEGLKEMNLVYDISLRDAQDIALF